MNDSQAQRQPTQAFSSQRYPTNEPPARSTEPLEEMHNPVEGNVVRALEDIDPLSRSTVRLQHQANPKPRSQPHGKQTIGKSFRRFQGGDLQLYAHELQRLETLADQINRLLDERARQKGRVISDPYRTIQLPADAYPAAKVEAASHSGRQKGDVLPLPALDRYDDESLRMQCRQIEQRLLELDQLIHQAQEMSVQQPTVLEPSLVVSPQQEKAATPNYQASNRSYPERYPPVPSAPKTQSRSQHPGVQPPTEPDGMPTAAEALSQMANPQMTNRTSMMPQPMMDLQPEYPLGELDPSHPMAGRSHPESHPESSTRFSFAWLLDPPQTTMDWVGDAALWLAISVGVRVGLKVLVAMLPSLGSLMLPLMLIPAIGAFCALFFVRRISMVWVYRLFFITLGFVIGSKF